MQQELQNIPQQIIWNIVLSKCWCSIDVFQLMVAVHTIDSAMNMSPIHDFLKEGWHYFRARLFCCCLKSDESCFNMIEIN